MNLTLAKAVDRYVGGAVCRALAVGRAVRSAFVAAPEIVEPRTVLLVKFWGLGNIVLLLPVIRSVRRRYPDARIVFVSLARNRALLAACSDVDRCLYVRDDGWLRLVTSYLVTTWRARRTHPDVCIDFEQFSRSSVILGVLAGARHLVGLSVPGRSRGGLHHTAVPYDNAQHMGQTYLDLARSAGVSERRYRPLAPTISDAGREEVARLLRGVDVASRLVVIHPGSGDNFQGRRWPVASFAALADRIVHEHDAVVVLTGTAVEASLTARVIAAMECPDRVLDAAGRLGVDGLTALLARSALLVTNDTAPVHLGSALGIPVFAFFGPNTPRLYGPLSDGSHAFYRDLPCSPCLTNMNYKTSLCSMPVCIRDITVEEVAARVHALLAGEAPAEGAAAPVARTG